MELMKKASETINKILSEIKPPDAAAMAAAAARQAALAKPPGSLGKLEEISVRLAGITGDITPHIEKCRVIVMCADNGVCAEGVSSAPVSVTAAQAINMTRRLTGMSSIAAYFGDDVDVVDVGISTPYDCPEIFNAKIRPGTDNIAAGPAMTVDETIRAIEVGISSAKRAADDGIDVIGVGEMGIGNTTTSSAVLAALTEIPAKEITGRGGGLTDEAFARKLLVIDRALLLNKPDPGDVIDVLAKVGGFDIAAMCGVFLGAAAYRLPAVIDGFISAVAALAAYKIAPASREYMFPSHVSAEPGYSAAMEALGLDPWLSLDMRLGEGSGCPLAFRVMQAACAAMNGMAAFGGESGIDDGYLDEIRKKL